MHEMVGLTVILETSKDQNHVRSSTTPQVVSKGRFIKQPTSPPISLISYSNLFSRETSLPNLSSCGFLEHCFLCTHKLLPGKDIFMYKGDKAFCSEECRCRQIFMDEEEGCARQ